MPRSPDLLVVAAYPPELEPLKNALGSSLKARVEGQQIEAHCVGIGLVEAAARTASLLAVSPPSRVIFVGSCGAYRGSGLVIGDVVSGRQVHLASSALVENKGAVPEVVVRSLHLPPADPPFPGVQMANVATTIAITTDDELADRFAAVTACQVEHLEAFAVARACALAEIPCHILLGVANEVGHGARQQWLAHHHQAEAGACEVLLRWIGGGREQTAIV